MATRTERTKTIEALEMEFKEAKGIYLTDINKIDVERITKLRNEIRKKGMKYIVVKNTLARIALERCGKKDLTPFLKGQIGVVVAQQESMAPAKIIRDFQKECAKVNKDLELLPVKVAYIDGTTFSGKETARLADIPHAKCCCRNCSAFYRRLWRNLPERLMVFSPRLRVPLMQSNGKRNRNLRLPDRTHRKPNINFSDMEVLLWRL
jgi:large subunit ribosomal protein L10